MVLFTKEYFPISVLSFGMFDIENNVLDLYYIYFGDVCIKDVRQIELDRVKKNGSSYDTVLVHRIR